ncbi:MAG: PQQ-binding-like beta-propeller repeat protein [Chloroflexota bacterium]
MHFRIGRAIAVGAVVATVVVGSVEPRLAQPLTGSNAAEAAGANVDWPTYGNTSDNTHFSSLDQITPANVGKLGLAWSQPEGPNQSIFENMPVVVKGVMYYTTNTDQVRAVDGATGKLLWQYTPKVNYYGSLAGGGGGLAINRGVAVVGGKVYLATFDARMIALQASTGEKLWESNIADPNAGYSESSGPTYWNGMLFIGGALGDSGQRGFVSGFDANTGKKLWTYYTVPAPGDGWMPAKGDHGGGDVWMPITVDTTTGMIYFGTGNPSPDFDNSKRPGCDQWADAVVALDAKTGKFVWAHSELCNDVWDYDSMPQPYLFNMMINGKNTRVLGHWDKAGFVFFYNAKTGKVISKTKAIGYYNMPHPQPSTKGAKVCPGTQGGTEFEPQGYNPNTGLVYTDYANGCFIFKSAGPATTTHHQTGQIDIGGSDTLVPGTVSGGVAAIDPKTGKIAWRLQLSLPAYSGILTTGSGLVFSGDDDGYFRAIDAKTGKVLWKTNLGLAFGAPPMTYEINGTQYIAIAVGGSNNTPFYDRAPLGGTLEVFKLNGKSIAKLAPVVVTAPGVKTLPTLKGYKQIGKWLWANQAKKLAVIKVEAAATGANNGFNFDGYFKGQATFTIPQYWSLAIEFRNDSALPHSAAITDKNVAPATVETLGALPAETTNATSGTTGKTWEIVGSGLGLVTSQAGHFYLSCLVPGHLASGMWDNFIVSSTAKLPSFTVSK